MLRLRHACLTLAAADRRVPILASPGLAIDHLATLMQKS